MPDPTTRPEDDPYSVGREERLTLPAQAGGAPVTPSALESGLAKLRDAHRDWCGIGLSTEKGLSDEEVAALLAYLTPTVPNSWNADDVLKRHGLYRELAPPDRGATAIRLLWLEQQNAALLAKIEAADRLAEFLGNLRADSHGVAGYHLNGDIAEWDEFEEMNLLAAYRAPQPAGGGE